MKKVPISSVNFGDYVRLCPREDAPIWIPSCFERYSSMYILVSYDDYSNVIFLSGPSIVYVDDCE